MEQYPIFHLSCGVTLSHLRPQKKKTEIPNASSKALRRWGRWRGCVFMRTCANHWPLLQRCSCLEWFGVDHLLRKLVQLCKIGWCLWKALTFLLATRNIHQGLYSSFSDFPAPNQPLWGGKSGWSLVVLALTFIFRSFRETAIHPGLVTLRMLYGCGNGIVRQGYTQVNNVTCENPYFWRAPKINETES